MGGGNSTKTTSNSQSQSAPWLDQIPFLHNAFNAAQVGLDTANNTPVYTGDITAGANPTQISALNNAFNFSNGTGQGILNGLFGNGQNQSTQGSGAVNSSINGLGSTIGGNNINGAINAGNAYAAGEDIPSLVNAATFDANRNAAENVLPAMARSDSVSGNLNSDRAALASGVVQRGLAENAQNISANLRNSAYNTGATLGTTETGQNLGALGALGGLGTSLSGLGNSAYTGGAYASSPILNEGMQAGAGLTAANQADLTNALQKYQASQTLPFLGAQQYYNLIGNRSWGSMGASQGVTDQQQEPSAMSSIGSGIGILGSLFGGGAGGLLGGLGSALGGLGSSTNPLLGMFNRSFNGASAGASGGGSFFS